MDETSVIRVRYWASAKAAAGTAEDFLPVTGPISLADVRRQAVDLHPDTRLAQVLAACSVLVGDVRTDDDALVTPGSIVEFLPPFAGG